MPLPYKGDVTGFDIRKLGSAPINPTNDPWRRAEAWRYTGPFTRRQRLKNLFPGFGIASAAFAVYLVYDYATAKDEHHDGHGKEHGEEQH